MTRYRNTNIWFFLSDFFDGDVNPSAEEEPEPAKPANMAEALPEGFFDDPKMDAKVLSQYNRKTEQILASKEYALNHFTWSCS